jgi:hypothetical protein
MSQESVKDISYRLWDEAGRPEGRDQEFWFLAEAALAKAQKPKAKPATKAKKPAAPKSK